MRKVPQRKKKKNPFVPLWEEIHEESKEDAKMDNQPGTSGSQIQVKMKNFSGIFSIDNAE